MLPSGWLSSVGLYCVHLVSLLLCLSALPSVSLGLTPECKEYLKDVAQSSSGFEVCALLCARPFRVCSSCFDDYAFAHNMFVNLKSVSLCFYLGSVRDLWEFLKLHYFTHSNSFSV